MNCVGNCVSKVFKVWRNNKRKLDFLRDTLTKLTDILHLQKIKKCLAYILTCLPDILTCPSDILPEKMPRCLSIILTCFPGILTWHANILPEKNAKLSLRYFHVSLGHLNIPLRHLAGKKTRCLPQILECLSGILPVKKMSPRHLNMSLKHFP